MYYSVLWARVIRRRLGSGLNHSGAKLQLSKLGQPRAPLITRALCARSPRSAELVHVYRLRRLQVSNRSNACRWAEAFALSLPLLNISLKQNKKRKKQEMMEERKKTKKSPLPSDSPSGDGSLCSRCPSFGNDSLAQNVGTTEVDWSTLENGGLGVGSSWGWKSQHRDGRG